MPDASPDYYFVLGRMICRAAEAEHMVESLLMDLCPNQDRATISASRPERVAKRVLAEAHRRPNQAGQIEQIVEVMRSSAEVRNWLVHAWILAPEEGDWVEAQKAVRNHARWGRRRITFDEVDALAARFVWVGKAITRVVNEAMWEGQGSLTTWTDDLPPVPPLPEFAAIPTPKTPGRLREDDEMETI